MRPSYCEYNNNNTGTTTVTDVVRMIITTTITKTRHTAEHLHTRSYTDSCISPHDIVSYTWHSQSTNNDNMREEGKSCRKWLTTKRS